MIVDVCAHIICKMVICVEKLRCNRSGCDGALHQTVGSTFRDIALPSAFSPDIGQAWRRNRNFLCCHKRRGMGVRNRATAEVVLGAISLGGIVRCR